LAKFPKLPLWTDSLIGDTHHLTPAEFGAYMRLLIAAWRRSDCALPNDDALLGRIVGDPRNWHRLKKVLGFFHLGEDGFYRQYRLLDERETVSRYAALSAAGNAAKTLKRLHRDGHREARDAPVTPPISPPPNPIPIPTKKKMANGDAQGEPPPQPKPNGAHPESSRSHGEASRDPFELFVATYQPKRSQPLDRAREVFEAALKTEPVEHIIAATKLYLAEQPDPTYRFAPERFLSEIMPNFLAAGKQIVAHDKARAIAAKDMAVGWGSYHPKLLSALGEPLAVSLFQQTTLELLPNPDDGCRIIFTNRARADQAHRKVQHKLEAFLPNPVKFLGMEGGP